MGEPIGRAISIIAAASILVACGAESNSHNASADAPVPSSSELSSADASSETGTLKPFTPDDNEKGGKWTYDTQTDEMRGTKTYLGSLESENSQQFSFPYQGGRATMTIRQRPQDGLSIIIEISGQFLCNSFEESRVSVKFDDGPIQRYSCSEPSDGRTGALFINGERRFLSQLRKAKKTVVEAEFYQEGQRQMVFDTDGLVWPPVTPKS